jgi:hypothetical protein
MDPAGTGWSFMAEDFPKDITILRANSTILYEDGTRAEIKNGLYDHHLIFVDRKKSQPSMAPCEGRATIKMPMSIFIGGSEDMSNSMYTTPDGKFNSGYYIGKEDPIMMSGDVVNYTNETKIVYTKSDVEYVQGRSPGQLEVSTQVLSIGACDSLQGVPLIHAPNGQKKFTISGKGNTVAQDGYILSTRKL